MQTMQERGRPIWFNQMEQHITLKLYNKALEDTASLSIAEQIIISKTRDKFARYVGEQGRTSNNNEKG